MILLRVITIDDVVDDDDDDDDDDDTCKLSDRVNKSYTCYVD